MKKWGWVILGITVVIGLGIYSHWRYKAMVAQYQDQVAQMMADRTEQDIITANALALADAKAKEAALYKQSAKEKDATLVEVQKELQNLKDHEPVAPELETTPLVINLRAQISTLQRALDLSISAGQDKDMTISAQEVEIASWKTACSASDKKFREAEAARLSCENLLKESSVITNPNFFRAFFKELFSVDTIAKFGLGFMAGTLTH